MVLKAYNFEHYMYILRTNYTLAFLAMENVLE